MPVLESYRGRDIVGVEELAGVANSLIEHYGREAVREPARAGISSRTVRHYLSEALLGEPTGQTGASIIFNYGNLLRLLAVKKLLTDNWSVIKVKELMRTLDITALEEFVNRALLSFTRQHQAGRHVAERDATRHTRSLESSATEQESASQSNLFAVEPARRREPEVGEWIEIAPGLEIKVRRSFRPPASEEDRARLAMRFWSVVMKEE